MAKLFSQLKKGDQVFFIDDPGNWFQRKDASVSMLKAPQVVIGKLSEKIGSDIFEIFIDGGFRRVKISRDKQFNDCYRDSEYVIATSKEKIVEIIKLMLMSAKDKYKVLIRKIDNRILFFEF